MKELYFIQGARALVGVSVLLELVSFLSASPTNSEKATL